MRWSETFIPTLKEDPSEAEVVSHRLMLRAGLIRKLFSGAYTYLPLGRRALLKVIDIVRTEMDRAGALEIIMPTLHPSELWHKTGRYEDFGDVLMKLKDRHGREFVLGPTHEEVLTDLAATEISSYRQLPVTFYQIQTKMRDEPRPRFGILRTCEFIMKDAYSLDADVDSLDNSYNAMYNAYCRIFARAGLPYVPVEADTGPMGGSASHEFMVPCDAGEDQLVTCDTCGYGANLEKGEPRVLAQAGPASATPEEVATPGMSTIEQVSRFLNRKPCELLKTLIFVAGGKPIAVIVRGDHDVNELKLASALKCELELADPETIQEVTGAPVGFAGPVGLKIPIYADHDVASVNDCIVGANKADTHIVGVNHGRDFEVTEWIGARYAVEGDGCPRCAGTLRLRPGIEIGHVFKLGTKYSEAMGATYLDEHGHARTIVMGCYGIGINRIIASAIECSHDEDGIIWPITIAPYEIEILALNSNDEDVMQAAEELYGKLGGSFDVLLDARKASPGGKFKDADLVGIPVQVIVGRRGLKNGEVELRVRGRGERRSVPVEQAADAAAGQVQALREEINQRVEQAENSS